MQNAADIGIQTKNASAVYFGVAFVFCCMVAAVLIGAAPLTASIVTIFAFAGIHNFMEFRYFVARMPVRWGRSRVYYSVAIAGVVLLTASYLVIYFGSGTWTWLAFDWGIYVSIWNTAFVLWIGFLLYMRGRQKPKSDYGWAFAAAFFVAALAWIAPSYWSISLVYIHPFIAMWFFERQIRRSRPDWLKAYRVGLLAIPIFVTALWFIFAQSPNLSEETPLFEVITRHAGAGIIGGVSTHFLVATHVFLETIHYFVWILLIPIIDRRAIPWRLKDIPLAANRSGFPRLVFATLCGSAFLMILLWFGFATDYYITRDVYFAFAIGHVLAEIPFLVKML